MTSVNTNKVAGFLSYCVQHNSHFKIYGPIRVKKAHKGGNGLAQIYLVMNAMATCMQVFAEHSYLYAFSPFNEKGI